MLKVSEQTKDAYRGDGIHKELTVTIGNNEIILTNENIVTESLKLTESIESGNNLSFTGCIASSLQLEAENLVQDVKDKEISVSIHANGTEERIPLFKGYITDVTNPSHEEITTKLTCYDKLYYIGERDVTDWYNSLSFPMTVMSLRARLCSHLGIIQEETYLPNDGITLQKSIENSINGLDLLKYICQINGYFGQINRNGILVYRYLTEPTEALYPREDLYPAENLYPSDENALETLHKAYYKKTSFEAYRVASIDKIQLVNKDGEIASIYGGGSNAYTIQSNPLLYGLSTSVLNNIAANLYNTIQGLWYTPSETQAIGLPYVECGDFVMLAAKYSIIRAYVLTRTLTGIQCLEDYYEAKGDKTMPIYKPSIQTQVDSNTKAISDETDRASSAEAAETARATAVENQIKADVVNCSNLIATKASINDLNAAKASINDLYASKASVSSLNAVQASVNSLSADKASISDLNAVKARVSTIESKYITTSSLSSTVIKVAGVNMGGDSLGKAKIKVMTGATSSETIRYVSW